MHCVIPTDRHCWAKGSHANDLLNSLMDNQLYLFTHCQQQPSMSTHDCSCNAAAVW